MMLAYRVATPDNRIMAQPVDPALFKDALIVLGSASVVIPLFQRFRVSPVLGFMLVGLAVGPAGLGRFAESVPWLSWVTLSDAGQIQFAAELGIVVLLFMIGLELSFERLKATRRLVFLVGPLQVGLCALCLGFAAWISGETGAGAAILGLALAMSSTAVVVQVLSSEKRLTTTTGRTSIAVLIFQDLAVIPVLFVVGVLSMSGEGRSMTIDLVVALLKATAAIVLIVVVGRLVLRRLFRMVARTGSPEFFMASCLLVILGSSLVATLSGLSMALGAFVAGLLLAETEYRRQIEVMIEPFKGLLIGVFLILVGMSINVDMILGSPVMTGLSILSLIAIKGLIIWALLRLFGVSAGSSLQSALLLAPAGEFTVIILSSAGEGALISEPARDLALLAAAVSMAMIPMLSALGGQLRARLTEAKPIDPALMIPQNAAANGPVIIAGFGRVGQLVASMLEKHGQSYLAVDSNPDVVARAQAAGAKVYFGDLSQLAFLRACELDLARALVITMDAPQKVEEVVKSARGERGDLLIVARARDAKHAAKLYRLGATDAVPETVEASLLLSEATLVDIGIPIGLVLASIHDKREELRAQIQALAPDADGPRLARMRSTRSFGKQVT